MRRTSFLFSLGATLSVAFAVLAMIFLGPGLADAADANSPSRTGPPTLDHPLKTPSRSGEATCTCPPAKAPTWARPRFAELPPTPQRTALDETDEVAALESVQFALTEVGDGASYIWHRNNGHLSGMVQPVASFKDARGQVCRHVVVILVTGIVSRKTEGVACRLPSGQWQLDG